MNLRNYFFARPPPPPPSKKKLSEKDLQDIEQWRNRRYRQQNLNKLQQQLQQQKKKAIIQRQKISNLQKKEKAQEDARNEMYETNENFFKGITRKLNAISRGYNNLLQEKANENAGGFSRAFRKQYMKENHDLIIRNFKENFKDILQKIRLKRSKVKDYTILGDERKILFLEVVVHKVIFQKINISGNNINNLLGSTQKRKLGDNLNIIRNIYTDYPLLCYLIETSQIQNFVTDNKVFKKFFKIEHKNNTILIVDNFKNSYYLHERFLHPKLYKFFLSLIQAQTQKQKQKQIQFQIRNPVVPGQKSKIVNKTKALELLGY